MEYVVMALLLGAALAFALLGSLATPDDRTALWQATRSHVQRLRVWARRSTALPTSRWAGRLTLAWFAWRQPTTTATSQRAPEGPSDGSCGAIDGGVAPSHAPEAKQASHGPSEAGLTRRVAPLAWHHPNPDAPTPLVGQAADRPPTGLKPVLDTLAWLDTQLGPDPYRFGLGWRQLADGSLRLETATYTPGLPMSTKHGATSGQTNAGKGVFSQQKILSLLTRTTPEQYQVCILDGKRLDFYAYRNLAQVWGLANTIAEFPGLLARLDAERERRQRILNAAGKKNWQAYRLMPGAETLPLLHVYVAELALLEGALGKEIWTWLNDHLTTARAFGFVFDVDLQTASNTPTLWRRQLQLFVAGYQPSPDDDRPNTTLTGDQIRAQDAIPPSELPGEPGYFCVVHGRRVMNLRAPYVGDAEEDSVLAALPRRATPTPDETPDETPDQSRLVVLARRLMQTQHTDVDGALALMGVAPGPERDALKELFAHDDPGTSALAHPAGADTGARREP